MLAAACDTQLEAIQPCVDLGLLVDSC
jgi:hypothetical protein